MAFIRRPTVLVGFSALLFHAALLFFVQLRTGSIETFSFRSLDSREYSAIGRNVAEHGVFSQSAEPPLKPDTWRTPGYPIFLAAIILVFGPSSGAVVVVQQLLGVFNVVLLFWIARRWMTTRRAAFASSLFLLEPYHLYYSLWIMAETWFTTVLLLIWFLYDRTRSRDRWHGQLMMGMLAGSAVLVKPVAIFVPMVIVIGLALQTGIGSQRVTGAEPEPRASARALARTKTFLGSLNLKSKIGKAFSFIVGTIIVVGTWMERNAQAAGRFAISDQSGVVMAYFKAAEVMLWRQGLFADRFLQTSTDPGRRDAPHVVWDQIDHCLKAEYESLSPEHREQLTWRNLAQGNHAPINSFDVSKSLGVIGWDMVLESPFQSALYGVLRIFSVLVTPLDLAVAPPNGIEINRARSLLIGSGFLVLCIFVILRLFRGIGDGSAVFFPLACTIALLLATTPQVDPRFRVPLIPLLVFLALLPKRKQAPMQLERADKF